MARNLLFVGDELQVNRLDPIPTLPPNGVVGEQFVGGITTLQNGNFLVVYQNNARGLGDQDIMSIEFTPNGQVVGAPFRVDFDAGDQQSPDVTHRIGGGYAAVWEEDDLSGAIHLAVFPPGAPPDPDLTEFPVADFTEDLESPEIATFANGTYIVVYQREHISSDDVWFAIVNATGTGFVTPNTGLVTTINEDESSHAVATSGNLAAVAFSSGNSSTDIKLSILNSAGNGVDFETVADIAGSASAPDVAALSDGRFVVVWMQLAVTADVMGRIYDPATKTFSGAAFPIAASSLQEGLATVAGLPDGGFVVTWTQAVGEPPNDINTVHARRFDASGAPAGDSFPLSDTAGQFFSFVAANDDGRVFTAWLSGPNPHSTDPDIGIDGQILRTATETVNGTAGDDTITTYSLSEPINGLGGKDTINAGAGDDIVNGGEGKDKLTGGPGSDAYVFDVKLKGKNVDHVTDFTPGVDQLRLDQDIFKKLKVGDLAKKAFFAGKKVDEGKDDKDLVIYDKKSGKFWYDADGPGGKDAKLVAILDGSPSGLKHEDIVVVA